MTTEKKRERCELCNSIAQSSNPTPGGAWGHTSTVNPREVMKASNTRNRWAKGAIGERAEAGRPSPFDSPSGPTKEKVAEGVLGGGKQKKP